MTKSAREWEFELWQGGVCVVSVNAPSEELATREIHHYAMMYGQDGPVVIRRVPPKKRAISHAEGEKG